MYQLTDFTGINIDVLEIVRTLSRMRVVIDPVSLQLPVKSEPSDATAGSSASLTSTRCCQCCVNLCDTTRLPASLAVHCHDCVLQ